MTEQETQLEAEKKIADESAKKLADDSAKVELNKKSVEELAELLSSTRSEAKQRRLKERELEDEIAKMKATQKAIDDAKLLEDGKIQELLDAKTLELTTTQSELEQTKTVAEELTTFKAAKVEDAKQKMGSRWNDSYATLPLTVMDKLANEAAPKIAGSDNGASGEHADVELTDDQKRSAEAAYAFVKKEKAWEYYKHNLIQTGKIKKKD